MIAVDTNILVYAHIDTFPKHSAARDMLVKLCEGTRSWGIPAACLTEFIRVVTHPRILAEPFSVDEAIEALDAVLSAPTATVLCPAGEHWPFLSDAARAGDARGNLAFDAAITATCQELGVTQLLTEDRDFHRFQAITTARLADLSI